MIDCLFAGNPLAADLIVVPRLGHFYQEGRKVQMFAIKKTTTFVKELQEKYEEPGRAFHFIGHQANLRMLETVCRRCEIPDDRHHFNVDWYGNSGSSSSAAVASMIWEKWGAGDDIAHGGRRLGRRLVALPAPLHRRSREGSFRVKRKLSYEQFLGRGHFDKAELLAFAYGTLVEDAPEALRGAAPDTAHADGRSGAGDHRATRAAVASSPSATCNLDDWFFQCHFVSDPVQPGCLGLDGVWQLLGFYCNWRGGLGTGRALGCGEVDFFGQIRPHDTVVRYEIDVRRYTEIKNAGACMVIGDARVLVDGEEIYKIAGGRVGLFRDIGYPDYPVESGNSHGGRMER